MYALSDLLVSVADLASVLDAGDRASVSSHAVDIANLAMKIDEMYGEPSRATPSESEDNHA